MFNFLSQLGAQAKGRRKVEVYLPSDTGPTTVSVPGKSYPMKPFDSVNSDKIDDILVGILIAVSLVIMVVFGLAGD